mgnify:CR=1 FL=1
MKPKHNKLKNSAILFELLVRQITTDTLNNQESKALGILKKYFNNTEVSKEYKIYNALTSAKNLSEQKADILISSSVEAYRKLNKTSLRKQKYDMVSEIKSNYNMDDFFKSNVDNYKTLASIYMLFEMDQPDFIDPQKYANCKFTIMESISATPVVADKDELLEEYANYDKGTRALVYKLMVKKFNEKYNDFDDRQKALLKEYINSISSTSTLKEYVNTEFAVVKRQLKAHIKSMADEARKVKLNEVLSFIQEIPVNKNVTDKEIHNLLNYYELLKEFDNLNDPK